MFLEICKESIMGTEYSSYQADLQTLLDPDTEADFATVIGLRILT